MEINFEELIDKASKIFEKESRLIQLPQQGKVVFVGDTHGDLEASRQVIRQYLKKPYTIVFLGDYVDRGDYSEENIQYLLGLKVEHPEEVFLLAGNHEGFMVKQFHPSGFWSSISSEEREGYGILFSKFPFVVGAQNGILAVHGALPDLDSLEEINRVELGDENWDRVVWGDFVEKEVEFLGDLWGRPQFGRPYFERMMDRYQKRVLVRSHQPHAPSRMFNKRCITIFTSHAYLPIRTVAIVDLEREIRNSEDLALETV
jgi:predicted phosphodiesterase